MLRQLMHEHAYGIHSLLPINDAALVLGVVIFALVGLAIYLSFKR